MLPLGKISRIRLLGQLLDNVLAGILLFSVVDINHDIVHIDSGRIMQVLKVFISTIWMQGLWWYRLILGAVVVDDADSCTVVCGLEIWILNWVLSRLVGLRAFALINLCKNILKGIIHLLNIPGIILLILNLLHEVPEGYRFLKLEILLRLHNLHPLPEIQWIDLRPHHVVFSLAYVVSHVRCLYRVIWRCFLILHSFVEEFQFRILLIVSGSYMPSG